MKKYSLCATMQKVKDFVFGKPLDPKEEVRKWKRELSHNVRAVEKSIRETDTAVKTHLKEVKTLLRKNEKTNAKTLAREVVNTQKYLKRLFLSKSLMTQIQRELDHSLALIRVQGTLQKSVNIMAYMNRLIRVPELAMVMKNMAKEMDRMGFIDEMIDRALGVDSDGEEEEEVDEEVNRVIDELNVSQLHSLLQLLEFPPSSEIGSWSTKFCCRGCCCRPGI